MTPLKETEKPIINRSQPASLPVISIKHKIPGRNYQNLMMMDRIIWKPSDPSHRLGFVCPYIVTELPALAGNPASSDKSLG